MRHSLSVSKEMPMGGVRERSKSWAQVSRRFSRWSRRHTYLYLPARQREVHAKVERLDQSTGAGIGGGTGDGGEVAPLRGCRSCAAAGGKAGQVGSSLRRVCVLLAAASKRTAGVGGKVERMRRVV